MFFRWMIRHHAQACCIGDSQGAHMLCVLSTTKCWLIVSSPRGAVLVGFHIRVRDQSEQWRQFMLCSVCDHHSEGEGGGSELRKQVVAVVRRCWHEDSAIVRMPLLLISHRIIIKTNICAIIKKKKKKGSLCSIIKIILCKQDVIMWWQHDLELCSFVKLFWKMAARLQC